MAVNVSSAQRISLLTTLALSILILLLHFPFDGYATQHSYTVPSFTACPKGDLKERLRELGAEEFNKTLTACQGRSWSRSFHYPNGEAMVRLSTGSPLRSIH